MLNVWRLWKEPNSRVFNNNHKRGNMLSELQEDVRQWSLAGANASCPPSSAGSWRIIRFTFSSPVEPPCSSRDASCFLRL
uniref:Uncharacterized protein n=1 Tax=Arundo donax TaxID=35708 RepID=A0A0A8ZP80_ARUDO